MLMKPETFSDGIGEIRSLSSAISATEVASGVDNSCRELVSVFMDSCSIAKEANVSIVEMVQDSIKTGEDSLQFVKTLLERIGKLEADLRLRFYVKVSVCFLI